MGDPLIFKVCYNNSAHWSTYTPPPLTYNRKMTFFYESEEDLALRGSGCLSGDSMFDDIENVTGMDIVDFIEANFSSTTEDNEECEYREDKYSQMAERHHVWWCNYVARDIICAYYMLRSI